MAQKGDFVNPQVDLRLMRARMQEMKKSSEFDLKKILTEQRKEYQNYLGVVVEDFSSQLKIIAEAVTSLTSAVIKMQKQIIALQEMVAQNTMDLTMMKEDIAIMKEDLGMVRGDLKQKAEKNYC